VDPFPQRAVQPEHVVQVAVERAVSLAHRRESFGQVLRLDPHRGHQGLVRGDAAGRLAHRVADHRQARDEPLGLVGQQVVRLDVVVVHACNVVGEGADDAGPVLARRAVHQDCALAFDQRLEVAAIEVDVAVLERRVAVIVQHVVAERGDGQV